MQSRNLYLTARRITTSYKRSSRSILSLGGISERLKLGSKVRTSVSIWMVRFIPYDPNGKPKPLLVLYSTNDESLVIYNDLNNVF
jgi:hypothetical protein